LCFSTIWDYISCKNLRTYVNSPTISTWSKLVWTQPITWVYNNFLTVAFPPLSSHMLEYNSHMRYNWVVVIVNMTCGKFWRVNNISCVRLGSKALHWVPIPMPMGFGWAWVRCYCSWVGIGFVHPCIRFQIKVKLSICMEYTNQEALQVEASDSEWLKSDPTKTWCRRVIHITQFWIHGRNLNSMMGGHMSCYGWALVGIGRWWWLWSRYGYKFEGKCWALLGSHVW
jgi:hypothetical protein